MDEVTRLARAAGAGDRYALAAFVRATEADVWRLCGALVDRQSADDLTQDTFLRALPALGSFRGASSARTWILAIARRACADEVRRRMRRRSLAERLERRRVPGASGPADGAVELELLLEGLDPDRREAFVLTQVLGLEYADAATVCGCPIGTIRSRVARARADLADMLADEPVDRTAVNGGRRPSDGRSS